MKLEPIDDMSPETWDKEIEAYDGKCLFHQSAWLDFLEATQGGKVFRFRIIDKEPKGYFACLVVRKGPFNILGSPLRGWTTDYMGPIADGGLDGKDFVKALEEVGREMNIHHMELCCPLLKPDIMRESGFSVSEDITYVVPLSQDEEEMWKRLDKKSCQYSINKAEKTNLIVEERYDDSFVEEYYRQLREVFGKQRLVPTYSIERIERLFKALPADLLLALRVRNEDETVATGIFPHDKRCVYFFGGASWLRFHKLCPNELLHWTLMKLSGKMGITRYDMCGKGSFKPKFGGQKTAVYRYSKSYSFLAKAGRELYRLFFFMRQRIRGEYLHSISRLRASSHKKE